MLIQLVAIALLAVIALSSFLTYSIMNRTYYIEYREFSDIDYKVQYKENDFFEAEWIGADQVYISALVEQMTADFNYVLNTGSSDLDFTYRYKIDAKMVVANKEGDIPYYTVEENLHPLTQSTVKNTSDVKIDKSVDVDYVKYNEMANSFINAYGLKYVATATLVVTLDVEILSSSKHFDKEARNVYSTSMNVPLAVDSFNVYATSISPAGEMKTLEYQDTNARNVFLVLGITTLALACLMAVALLVFLYLTKNEDITYSARVRKILRTYGSYIQRMNGEFDAEGYQIVMIKTFTEMLGIRDTIQSPILASENSDETMTRFLIPTNTQILYIFELKVDNYDVIYNTPEPEPEITVEPLEPLILEEIDEEILEEAVAQPDIDIEEIDFVPDDDDQFAVAPEEPGIEVVGVVWPEKAKQNKVYRYDPNGEVLEKGDIVLAPTFDKAKGREVLRKAAVAHENHRVDPEHIKHPLKKIVAVVRRSVEHSLTPNANKASKTSNDEE